MVYDQYDNTLVRDLNERRRTFDIDAQFHLRLGAGHDLMIGGGYRISADKTEGTDTISLDDPEKTLNRYNVFVQNRITLVANIAYLTLGSKFEHNDFTVLEVQPNARLLWTPTNQQSVWLSVARAVRGPTRTETGLRAINGRNVARRGPNAGNVITRHAFGNDDVDSEKLIAYELGYRVQPAKILKFDITAFFNDYRDLIDVEPASPIGYGLTPADNTAQRIDNNQEADVHGVELAAEWTISDFWRLNVNYSYLEINIDTGANPAGEANAVRLEESSPAHQANLWTDDQSALEYRV